MDGHEVFRRVRAEPTLVDLPVIFLSGRSADEFDDYEGEHVRVITKPFDPSHLVAAVLEAIGMVAP
jgi:CheY-like chemotaxis protein